MRITIPSWIFATIYALQFVVMLTLPRTQANMWALAATAFATLVFLGQVIFDRVKPSGTTNARPAPKQ
jgi:hypothetical protein